MLHWKRSDRSISQIHLEYYCIQSHIYKRKEKKKRNMTFDLGCFSSISFCSHSCEETLIILSKHIIVLLIHILLSMSVLIKGEAPVERYHAHWLEIGGLNNQAKIKGRLCFRVSHFAWIRLVSWSGLWGGGERGEKDRNKGGWMWQLRHSSSEESQYLFPSNWIRSKVGFLNMLIHFCSNVQMLSTFYTVCHISVAYRMGLSFVFFVL